ncbi:hypothetical protein L1887_24194 [Cichorium endivia]|nr:hypothetical protein L1887_24194 [Cichorium endivia]
MDGNLENIIIASSSAEEDNSMGNKTPTIRNSQTKNQPLQTAKKRNIEEDMEWVPSQQLTGAVKKIGSEKDEITLLEVLKKRSDKGNMSILYKAVKKHLDAEFSQSQVTDKVRRFKKKFNTSEKALPASSHDAKIHKLCKEIWGGISEAVVGGPHMTKKEFQARYPRVNASIDDLPPYNNMTDEGKNVIKECMLFISPKEIEDLEDELMDYHEEELERATKQMLLSNKQSKLLQKGTRFYNEAHQN